ncbi:MAG: hypothetical protein ACRBCL_07105 [Maritimibacter sp.]
MSLRVAFWAFVALACVGFCLVFFWAGPMVKADGVVIFDMRTAGYSLAEAQAILAQLSDDARAAYLGPERLADTIFPIGICGTLALGIILGARVWSLPLALGLALVPLGYFIFDMLENAGVARMLLAGPEGIEAEGVARVSQYTQWKFRLVNLSLGLIVVIWGARGVLAQYARKTRQT